MSWCAVHQFKVPWVPWVPVGAKGAEGAGAPCGQEAPVQRRDQILRRCKPIVGILFEGAADDAPQLAIDLWPLGIRGQRLRDRARQSAAAERMTARQHFVEQDAKGKLIRPRARRLSEELFRRHVGRRAGDHTRVRQARHRREVFGGDVKLREPEIQDLHAAAWQSR